MIPISENIKDWVLIYGLIYWIVNTIGTYYLVKSNKMYKKHNNELFKLFNQRIDKYGTLLNKFNNALERENYLIKAMNDAWKVVDMRSFLKQRMSNAPEKWKPKTKEEINPDKIE